MCVGPLFLLYAAGVVGLHSILLCSFVCACLVAAVLVVFGLVVFGHFVFLIKEKMSVFV